jgi:simple sugar transport system permease protein
MATDSQDQLGVNVADFVLGHRNAWSALVSLGAAVAVSLALVTVLLLATGVHPGQALAALVRGAFGSLFAVASTLRWAAPLILAGLAVVIGLKAGVFNAGLEGQLLVGGFVATWVGFTFTLPHGLHPLMAVLLGGGAGAFWALVPALLKVYCRASEIVTTLMLNYVALGLIDFVVREYFRDPLAAAFLMTAKVHPSAVLLPLLPVGNVSVMIFIAVGLVPLVAYLLRHRTGGYEISMTGLNSDFATYGGISAGRAVMWAMLASGFLGGVIGASECLGINQRFVSRFSPGYGFDGFLVALLGGASPLGVLPAGFLMSALKSGSLEVERSLSVGKAMVWILQGTIIALVSARVISQVVRRRDVSSS